jgi:threonine aldolase
MGGAMRQAGILAAAGIYALNHLVGRLAEDHRRAREMAEHLNSLPGLCVDLETVQTNIVRVKTDAPAPVWQTRLAEAGVRCFATGPNSLRLVFHREIDDGGLAHAKRVFSDLCQTA